MFLKDYHRKNLLSGAAGDEDTPMTYLQEQGDLKRTRAAGEPDSDADDADADFLVKKRQPEKVEPIIDIPDPLTADPNNPEGTVWKEFEKAYNFRFEGPDANTRGKLMTYGRDAISANTVRREEISGRKKAREKKREKQQAKKELREKEKGRLRKLKTEELMEKFRMIREAAGLDDDGDDKGVEAEVLDNPLEVRKYSSYYEADVDKLKKLKFDDEIDMGDIVADLEYDVKLDLEDEGGEAHSGTSEGDEEVGGDVQTDKKSRDRGPLQKEKRRKKQKEGDLKRKLEQYVEENYDFEDQTIFRYQETTPKSYGLTSLDVPSLDILAAEDADLNFSVGLKKLATFREPEKKKKDKKRYGKKKRLREWRKETFGDEEGVKIPADWKPTGITEEKESNVDIRGAESGERKKRRRKGNKS
ncbi:KRI1-like family C-terminal-domain-containing protein [Tuber brumale]|nr:KRI1-like family C-terminal-domain-containing protein [Tuber brumale]